MSGHSKWSTIKRKKGAKDAQRSKVFTKIIKEITVAARMGGGNIDGNHRLRRAVDLARSSNMPNDNITRAIKKGTGELEGVQYEELIYEGVGPGGTLFIITALTDNRNRTAPEFRRAFEKNGGQLGVSGSAAWAFEEKGILKTDLDAASEEQLFEVAVGAGAEDIAQVNDDDDDGGEWVITTAREAMETVREAMDQANIAVREAQLAYIPTTPKIVEGEEAEQCMQLFDALEDQDDSQVVFADFELSDAAMAALSEP